MCRTCLVFRTHILNRASRKQMPTSAKKVTEVAGVSTQVNEKYCGEQRMQVPCKKRASCYSILSLTRHSNFSEARNFVFI